MRSTGWWGQWPLALKLPFLALIPALNVSDAAGALARMVERRRPSAGGGSSSWLFSRVYFRVCGAVGIVFFGVMLGVSLTQPL